MSDAEITAALAVLRERFLRNAAGRLEELARALDVRALDRIIHSAHNLAGLGGTYGFDNVSELARSLEAEARAAAAAGEVPEAQLRSWRKTLATLAAMLEQPGATASAATAPEQRSVVLCVTRSKEIADHLAAGAPASVEIRHATSVAEAEAMLRSAVPDVLVAECQLPDGNARDVLEILRAQPGGDAALALVFGTEGSAMKKVELLRSGADSLVGSHSPEAIAKRLAMLLERRHAAAQRILSVEDDPDQAAYLSTVLGSAGYSVRICDDPALFEADLLSFRPDLILMDLDLPGVRGDELARIVRQSDDLATLPIVFLSASTNPAARLQGIRAGADDFLTKPVAPPLLLAVIAAKIERSRHLASLFERDGITGLLTHSAFFDKLNALWRARDREPATLVLIDLDHFKKINDRYGHLTGDRVLASFGALARRRLRALDLVGRYGGEEFALVVTDVTADEAFALTERLREDLAALEHTAADGTTFRVTFSAGVAPLSEQYPTVDAWIAAADAALYRAKAEGRNRVVEA